MESSQSKTAVLASTIGKHTAIIEDYLQKHKLAPLSFDLDAQFQIHDYPPEIEASRWAVINATQELNDMLQGPRDSLMSTAFSQSVKPVVLHFIMQFEIYKHVPLEGDISYENLSHATGGVGKSVLRHILCAAISMHIFRESRLGYVAHNATSQYMRENQFVQDRTWQVTTISYPAMHSMVEMLRKHPAGDDPKHAGVLHWFRSDASSFFDHLNRDPTVARRFVNIMAACQEDPTFSLSHVTDNYPFSKLKPGSVIVDIGGSQGALGSAIAKAAPQARVVVQDQWSVISQVDRSNEAPKDVIFMAHSFYDQQPLYGADVYSFRWVFHDWPDRVAIQILRSLIPAMKPGAKVLIIDEILAPKGALGLQAERNQHAMDIMMLSLFFAKERYLDEWKELFAAADERFVLTMVKQPQGSQMSLLELTWQPGKTSDHGSGNGSGGIHGSGNGSKNGNSESG